MMMAKKIKAERLDNGAIRVEKGTWSDTIPADQVNGWADWYDRMHQQHGYAGYREMAEALRAVKAS